MIVQQIQQSPLQKIQHLINSTRQAVIQMGVLPFKRYQTRFSLEQFRYLVESQSNIQFSLKSLHLTTRLTHLLFLIKQLLLQNQITTKRHIYYRLIKHYHRDYQRLSTDLKIISRTLKLRRSQLNIIASSKGIVCGNVVLMQDGHILQLNQKDNYYLPQANDLRVEQINCKYVIVIQKESMFNYFRENYSNDGNYLLITAKGYPDYKTREFVSEISQKTQHIYYLGDVDPFGYDILLCYAIGDEFERSGIPNIRWLDVQKLLLLGFIDQQRLEKEYLCYSQQDQIKIEYILSQDYFKQENMNQKLRDWKSRILSTSNRTIKIQLQSIFKCIYPQVNHNILLAMIKNELYN